MDLQERIERLHRAIVSVADASLPADLKVALDDASLAVGELASLAPLEHLSASRPGKPNWRLRLGRHLGHA